MTEADYKNKQRIQKFQKFRQYNHSLSIKWHKAQIVIPYDSNADTFIDWCKANCIGRFSCSYSNNGYTMAGKIYIFYFKDLNDCMQFQLVWHE